MTDQKKKIQALEALQLHYTSCQHGISGYAGFQVRAISEGIMPDEQRVLERLGMYEPPRNMPSEPSPEEIQDSFPKAFRSIFLETGKLAVTRSVYAGQDYTGRWGNYFAHALVFKSPVSDLWPVDLYEWEGWKEQLSTDEDTPEASTVLSPITVQPDTGAYAFTELQEFLQEDSSRTGRLADMIRAALLHKSTSRKLVIKEELESVGLFWVACLQKAFSPACQKDLGCSTYQFEPRSCLAINVTLHETDFILGETERLYQFYVFDFQENTFSEIAKQQDDYAETVAGWMSEAPDVLQEFHQFSRMFDCSALDDSLFSMLRLFQLYKGEKEALPQDELVNLLEFSRLRSKKDAFEKVIHIIDASAQFLMQSDDPVCMKALVLFFVSCLDTGTREQYTDPICNILLRMFHYAQQQNNFPLYEQAAELRVQVREKIPTLDRKFSKAFLAEEHLAIINDKISSCSDEILAAAMKELVAAVHITEPAGNEYEDDKVIEFIENIVSAKAPHLNTLNWMVELSLPDPFKTSRLFSVISRLNLDNDSIKNLAKLFSEILSDKEQGYRITVIDNLKNEQSSWPLLYEDWRRCIDKKKRKKISAHSEYCQLILNDDSAYTRKAKVQLAEELWERRLSEKEKNEYARNWIDKERLEIFPISMTKDISSRASEKVSFNPSDMGSEKLARRLIKHLGQHHTPHRLQLRQVISNAYAENKSAFDERRLSELNEVLHHIDKKTYGEFIKSYLPKMLHTAKDATQHRKILRYVFIPSHNNIFSKMYTSYLRKGSFEQFDTASKAALYFWLFLRSKDKDYNLVSPLRESALDTLALRISKWKNTSYFNLIQDMGKNRELTCGAKKVWNTIQAASYAKRNDTLIGKLKNKLNNFISKA